MRTNCGIFVQGTVPRNTKTQITDKNTNNIIADSYKHRAGRKKCEINGYILFVSTDVQC